MDLRERCGARLLGGHRISIGSSRALPALRTRRRQRRGMAWEELCNELHLEASTEALNAADPLLLVFLNSRGVFIIGTPTLLQGSDAQDERGIP